MRPAKRVLPAVVASRVLAPADTFPPTAPHCTADCCMPFADASFDKIYCLDVLAHFKDGERGIREVFRVLRRGGKLIITTPNKYYTWYTKMVQRIRKRKWKVKYDDTARWLYGKSSLERSLAACPWSSIHCFYDQAAPRCFPVDWMRQTVVAVATK